MMKSLWPFLAVTTLAWSAEPVALFNGKDFSGWKFDLIDPAVPPDTVWTIKDGTIVCKGRPPGILRTTSDFSRYELILDWRWAPYGKPGNSGVLVHASSPREMWAWPKSVEIQLAHENAGDFWTIGESLRSPGTEPKGRRWTRKQGNFEKPPGEWNQLRLRCEGSSLTVWINGHFVNHATDLSTTRGAICLQSEGREVHFRNLLLTPIE